MSHFFIDIAQRLKAAKIPGYVTTMSYHPYHLIPQPDIPDNLIIELAMSGAWQEGNPGQAEADERLRAWVSKLKAKTYVWTYQNKQHLPWIPNYAPHAVGSFYQRQAPYIFGTFYEGENDIWLYSYLNYYIAGKVLWNSNADVDALIEEHHQLMFGPGANEMKQFFSALESKWMRQVVGNVVNTSLGPTVVRPPEHQLWGNIYSSEFLEEAEKLFATAASKAAAAPDAKKRIIFLRDNYLGPMQEGLRRYHGRISERDDWQGSFPAITAAERPVIDGKIDEQAWFKAEPLWLNARYNTKIEVATRGVRCRDQENLYFAFICDEPFTSAMAVAPSRSYDDVKIWQDNSVEILLDTEGKRQFHHQFIINSNGVWSDLQSKHRRSDFSWDCPAEVKTSVVPGVCWQAEVRIPIQALPAMTRTDRVYANFTRIRMLENENIETILYSWCRVAEDHRTEEFGVLSFEPVEDDNQLSDGDFAAPLSPDGTRLGQWGSSHKINRDTDYYKTAGASLRFDGSGSGTIRQWFKPLKPETTWELSFYLRMEDVGPDGSGPRAGFYARINDSGREAHYLPKIPLTGSMPWTRLSYRFTTSKLSDWPHSTIDFNPYRVNGKIWLDRVAIREVQPDR